LAEERAREREQRDVRFVERALHRGAAPEAADEDHGHGDLAGGASSGVLPGGFPDLLVVEVVDDDGWLSEVRHAVVLGAEIRQAMV
ncbi:MAG: hypothetical protein IJ658_00705, partial [Kiritimatiellae bacterium]|nr:hypothetical protein [Kiritimatiellia bacterium]